MNLPEIAILDTEHCKNVTIKNLKVKGYKIALRASNVEKAHIR